MRTDTLAPRDPVPLEALDLLLSVAPLVRHSYTVLEVLATRQRPVTLRQILRQLDQTRSRLRQSALLVPTAQETVVKFCVPLANMDQVPECRAAIAKATVLLATTVLQAQLGSFHNRVLQILRIRIVHVRSTVLLARDAKRSTLLPSTRHQRLVNQDFVRAKRDALPVNFVRTVNGSAALSGQDSGHLARQVRVALPHS